MSHKLGWVAARFLRDKRNQEVLGRFGRWLVGLAAGLWVAFVALFPNPPGGLAQTFTPPGEIRHDTSLVEGWRFIKDDVPCAEQENFDDQSWAVISIPHTW